MVQKIKRQHPLWRGGSLFQITRINCPSRLKHILPFPRVNSTVINPANISPSRRDAFPASWNTLPHIAYAFCQFIIDGAIPDKPVLLVVLVSFVKLVLLGKRHFKLTERSDTTLRHSAFDIGHSTFALIKLRIVVLPPLEKGDRGGFQNRRKAISTFAFYVLRHSLF